MPKQPVSVTLDDANLVWLRGRAKAAGARSVSDLLDQIVTEARLGGGGPAGGSRSVKGTIDIAADDPDLEGADEAIRALVQASLGRPFLVRGTRPGAGSSGPSGRKRRRG